MYDVHSIFLFVCVFQGFVRVFCEAKCKVEFHYNCWRVFKSKIGEKIGDKVFQVWLENLLNQLLLFYLCICHLRKLLNSNYQQSTIWSKYIRHWRSWWRTFSWVIPLLLCLFGCFSLFIKCSKQSELILLLQDMLEKVCPTPSCGTLIVKISINRKGAEEKHVSNLQVLIDR